MIILYPQTGFSARFQYIRSKSCQKQRPDSTFQRNFARIAYFPCASVQNSEISPCQSNLFRANGCKLPVFCVKPFSQASRRRLTAFCTHTKTNSGPKEPLPLKLAEAETLSFRESQPLHAQQEGAGAKAPAPSWEQNPGGSKPHPTNQRTRVYSARYPSRRQRAFHSRAWARRIWRPAPQQRR